MQKVIYVSNNHPSIRPGGLEIYADELFRAINDAGEFDAIFVSKIGPPHSEDVPPDGSRFSTGYGDQQLYYFHTHTREFDYFLKTARRKRMYVDDWRTFLLAHRPDVVHFHHSDFLGFDMVRETRRTLPEAAIVYTLHEFVPICHRNGQMVREKNNELCDHASPRRCHQCFPNIAPEMFLLRERLVRSAFEFVDLFIAPSEQLRQRYISWGIDPEIIIQEDYGRRPVAREPDPDDAGRRRRIGFFGQMTRYKGVDVLLEAMKILQRREVEVQLLLRGANLDLQRKDWKAHIQGLLDETAGSVRVLGRYEQTELPRLMSAIDWVVVPSIWWENLPLVIQESMMHRRPVICSDIGGMAEKVIDGVNGLHFHRADPYSLSMTIERAVSSPELWDKLRAQIKDPHAMDKHVETISDIYRRLLEAGPRSTVPVRPHAEALAR